MPHGLFNAQGRSNNFINRWHIVGNGETLTSKAEITEWWRTNCENLMADHKTTTKRISGGVIEQPSILRSEVEASLKKLKMRKNHLALFR